MSVNKIQKLAASIVSSHLVWGGLASFGFYTLIFTGVLEGRFYQRYFTDHWVLYAETILFFVGLAWLVLKCGALAAQRALLAESIFSARHGSSEPTIAAEELLSQLDELEERQREGYVASRIRAALELVLRKRTGDALDDDLRYLAEDADNQAHASYAFLRFVVWAIPILGFLGTVLGITVAIANLSPQAMEQSLGEVTSGLGVAFDTTALALALSMVLMFGQYAVDRMERRLLADVDRRVIGELNGRIDRAGASSDPNVAVIRRMSEAVIKATELLVERQAALWQSSLESAEQRRAQLFESASERFESALGHALEQALERHADRLLVSEEHAAERSRAAGETLAQSFVAAAEAMKVQQAELTRQGATLLEIVQATGEVKRLEEALNSNMAALAGAQHFEETLLNLSAAVNLLNARMGQVASGSAFGAKTHPVGRAA